MLNIINSIIIAQAIDGVKNAVTKFATDHELVTETTSRTSHGKTTSTAVTTIRKKPEPAVEPKNPEPLFVQTVGWTIRCGQRADGIVKWGFPKWNPRIRDYEVPVKIVKRIGDDEVTINRYTIHMISSIMIQLESSEQSMIDEAISAGPAEKPSIYFTTDAVKFMAFANANPHDERLQGAVDAMNAMIRRLNHIRAVTIETCKRK